MPYFTGCIKTSFCYFPAFYSTISNFLMKNFRRPINLCIQGKIFDL